MSPVAADRGLYVWPTIARPPDPIDPADIENSSVLWLRTAPDIVYPPPISPNHAVVLPGDFPDADAMFDAYENVLDFLILCDGTAELRGWGPIIVNGSTRASGTSSRYRTIRVFNVADDHLHPYDRRDGNEALIDSIQFTNGAAYWMVIGFHQLAMPTQNDVRSGSHHIIFSRFLLQGQTGNYGFQGRAGDGCIVQQCCLLDPGVGGGLIGISPDPNEGAQTGFKSLDNEVRNYVDGMLVGYNPSDGFTNIDVHSEGNDYYQDGTRYLPGTQLAETENGIDIKGSSSLVQSVSRRDRIWGQRQYVGHAQGDAVEIHRWARNWLFDQVYIDDCRHGFYETAWDSPTDPETERDIVVTDSQFTRVRAWTVGTGAGSIFRCFNNLNVSNSWFADSDGVLYVPATMRAGGPVFNDNTRTSAPTYIAGGFGTPYVENDNLVGDPAAARQFIQCQRWTGGGVIFRLGAKITAVQLDREPVAAFSAILVGGEVTIAEAIVTYGGATIVSRNWNWGDGSADSTTANPTHTYEANGIYTITLDIEDSNGLTHKTQRHVWVTALPEPEMPRVRAVSAMAESQVAFQPNLPSGIVENDLLLLLVVTQGTQPATLSDAQGFLACGNSPQDVGLASGSVLAAFARYAPAGTVTAPTIADSGDHHLAYMIRIDRENLSDAFDLELGDILTTASTTGTMPGGTTGGPNRLILFCCTTGADSSSPQFSGHASVAPHVANLTELINGGTALGNGSGLLVLVGEKATQGAFGGATTTLASTFRQARMTFAIQGEPP